MYIGIYPVMMWFVFVSIPGGEPLSSPALPEKTIEVALEAWSEFARLGDPASLDGVFFVGGPQFEQLVREMPLGESPVRFLLAETLVRSRTATSATIWTSVRVEREGYQSKVLHWDFDLVFTQDGWRVWTVVPAERPAGAGPRSAAPTSDSAIVPTLTQAREGAAPIAAATPSNTSAGVRLPALSAWIIVITIAGVALAGYLAPRIDRRRER